MLIMTPSLPPTLPPNPPTDIGGWLTLIFTSVILAIVGAWMQLRAKFRKTAETPAVEPPPQTALSDNEDIAAMQIKIEVLRTEMNQKYDELDARIDYSRQVAEEALKALERLARERGEL